MITLTLIVSLIRRIKSDQERHWDVYVKVLKMVTINNAIALKIDNDYGTVEVGKKTDLIVLNKNPLEDLDNLKSIYMVMKDGFEHKF